MTRFYRLLSFIALMLILGSCQRPVEGNGNVTSEERSTGAFNKVELSGAYKVVLRPADQAGLEIETDENIHELLESTTTEDSVLRVENNRPIGNTSKLLLVISYTDLHKLRASGAVDLSNEDTLRQEHFAVTTSGASKMRLNVNLKTITINVSGAGEAEIRGEAEKSTYNISGAGKLKAADLKSRQVDVSITGAGKAFVYAVKKLDVNITGAGTIKYKGSPAVSKSISGAGKVEALN